MALTFEEITTRTTLASAAALASVVLSEMKNPALAFQITHEQGSQVVTQNVLHQIFVTRMVSQLENRKC